MINQSSMKLRSRVSNAFIYAFLSILSVVWLIPVVYLILMSFREEKGAWLDGYIMPKGYTFDNYIKLFTDTSLFNYPRWFMNTLIVAIIACLISTMYVLFTAFVFSRLRFKMRRKLMNFTLVLGMFPGFMSMIAIYHLLKLVGLDKSLVALILVYSGGAGLTYYITKGFFDTIPKTLDEAAKLDGATNWQVFWKITLPVSKPIITYTVLGSFIAPWLDFITASVIMKDRYENYTVALGLFRFVERENIYNYYTQFCAGAVIVSIPIALLFIFMQRYYVEGITGGSTKG